MTHLIRVSAILRSHIRYNHLLFLAILIAGGATYWLALQLRFDFAVPPDWSKLALHRLPYVAFLKATLFFVLQAHVTNWRYVGLRDVPFMVLYALCYAAILYTVGKVYPAYVHHRGVIVIDAGLTLVAVGGIRVSARYFREIVMTALIRKNGPAYAKAIIVGAGDEGEMLLREIRRNPRFKLTVEAFFDNDPKKKGLSIQGVRVIGSVEDVSEYVSQAPVDVALLATPTATGEEMARIHNALRGLGLTIRTLPPLHELVHHRERLTQLRDISIADLLSRKEIHLNMEAVGDLLNDRVVLVTGAGGSIGSELCRQILQRRPSRLIAVDKSENNLFHVRRRLIAEMPSGWSTEVTPILADLRYSDHFMRALGTLRPEIVFHAAAHKHVGMQELNPLECFINNVGSTINIAKLSVQMGVERFLLISTDKAVNPTSVMGATKRVCEMYCQALGLLGPTVFIAVRFGNVLGSEGSVVPIFLEQIERGGPVTVTHPDATRYFITVSEAVSLVLQATATGVSGRVLMLEMGKPVRILDLAHQLIDLADKQDQIPIVFSGLGPGEKIFEELSCESDACRPTGHPKITEYKTQDVDPSFIERVEKIMSIASAEPERVDIIEELMRLAPEYRPERTTKVASSPVSGPVSNFDAASGSQRLRAVD